MSDCPDIMVDRLMSVTRTVPPSHLLWLALEVDSLDLVCQHQPQALVQLQLPLEVELVGVLEEGRG